MIKHGYHLVASTSHAHRFRPEELQLRTSKGPMKLNLPENRLVMGFYKQFPEARLEPVNLASFQAPLAKQFALRVHALMHEGMGKKRAVAQAQEESAGKLQSLR